ncbi:MAG: DUF4174 domain-containing protein [Pseudomonadota bacterium]
MLDFFLVAFAPQPIATASLDAWRWRRRVLVVCAEERYPPAKGPAATQLQFIDHEGYAERDVALVYVADDDRFYIDYASKDAGAFGNEDRLSEICADDDFRVALIGKDGDVKASFQSPVAAEALFDIIDAMPMRRPAMRRR